MVSKRLPRQLWDYGISWVPKVILMTHFSSKSINVGIPLTNVTGKTVYISKYIDFFSMIKSGSKIIMVYLIVKLGCG